MAQDELSSKVGEAWDAHREGNHAEAISGFEQILQRDPKNVDAYYGMGLAQRADGRMEQAHESFTRAAELTETRLNEVRAGSEQNNLETTEDDRLMMLKRMISQRLAELS